MSIFSSTEINLSPNNGRVFVIAEIGKNFIQTEEEKTVGEYLENAKELVTAAARCGVDAVKFQTHEVDDEVLNINFTSPHFRAKDRYSWVSRNTKMTPLKEFWLPLKEHCDNEGVVFFSTPMSRNAAKKLTKVGVPLWKVGSGDVQDYILVNYLLETKKPIIISSGMVSLKELDEVIKYIRNRDGKLTVLYCVSQYPCPPEAFNLATVERLIKTYPEVTVGFSDHSLTHDATLVAVKLGARVIEKHFSFDRELWGADHKASILPDEMKELVGLIRAGAYEGLDTRSFYGDWEKELEGANNVHRPFFNKALMAGQVIDAGTVITEDVIYAMRPVSLAKGIPANKLENIIGKRAKTNLDKFSPITVESVE